jgi:hypothetical protein
MADVEDYSVTAASNTDDFPENQAPSTLNDGGRETQADIAAMYQRMNGTVTAGGTADALTASFTPAHTSLVDGRVIVITAASDNATTTPTLNLDTLGAKTITCDGNTALLAGSIQAGAYLILKYDAGNTVWELLNPTVRTIPAGSIPYASLSLSDSVAQGDIAASAIGQAEIKTTYGDVSWSAGIGGAVTLPGGAYGFYPRDWMTGGSGATTMYIGRDTGNTSPTTAITPTSTSYTRYARQYYFQASPPYDLGDGVVGQFIFALINNATSEVETVYSATEAPWHYNGKTDIRGKIGKDGKKYRLRKDMSAIPFSIAEAAGDEVKMAEYIEAFSLVGSINELVTQEVLQRDMNDIPHPFMSNDLTGKTVVMLDPVSDLNHKLNEMRAHDEFNLNSLFHNGYLKIGNTDIGRAGPKGVLIPSFKWKKTK